MLLGGKGERRQIGVQKLDEKLDDDKHEGSDMGAPFKALL